MRICTRQNNAKNRKLNSNNKTGIKGVSYYKKYNKWRARINSDNKEFFLGYFSTLDESKRAYDEAEKMYFGEFRRIGHE